MLKYVDGNYIILLLITLSKLAVSTRAGIENSVTVAKQKQLPSAGVPRYHVRGTPPEHHVSTNY